jgi:hypothetical protein
MASRTQRLRRRTDRVEDWAAWALTAAGLWVVVAGYLIGLHVHDRFVEQGLGEAADRTPGVARLIADAPTIAAQYDTGSSVTAPAAWIDRSGVEHIGAVSAPPGFRAGSTVAIWTDPNGAYISAPTSAGEALLDGVVAGGFVLCAGLGALLGLWWLVRWATMAANCVRWEREWREVATAWTRGGGTPG